MKETVILADDHPITLSGMSEYLKSIGYCVTGQFSNGITALNHLLTEKPDFAILDISMPGMNGLELLDKLRQHTKTQKVILYTMDHDSAVFEKAKFLGVNGYVLKDFALEELKECLTFLRHKKQWFSPRLTDALVSSAGAVFPNKEIEQLTAAEKKILTLIADRFSSKEIAEQLFLSEKTIENHRSNIIKKLGLSGNKNSLLLWAIDHRDHLQP